MKVHQNKVPPIRSIWICIFKHIGFSDWRTLQNKKVPVSVHYFSSSRCMPVFSLVGKVVLLICIKSAFLKYWLASIMVKCTSSFCRGFDCQTSTFSKANYQIDIDSFCQSR